MFWLNYYFDWKEGGHALAREHLTEGVLYPELLVGMRKMEEVARAGASAVQEEEEFKRKTMKHEWHNKPKADPTKTKINKARGRY